MFEYKLQIGALIILMYFIASYVKNTLDGKLPCNRIFDLLMIFAPWSIVFDGVTAWTVNHLELVPEWVNLVLHGLFFVFMDAVIILIFLYMIDQTIGIKKKMLGLCLTPGIISILIIVISLNRLYYVRGETTNYSMGIPVYACYVSLCVHFLLIILLIGIKHRAIEKRKLFGVVSFMIIIQGVLLIQIFFPETLISSLLPVLSLSEIYMYFENPALRRLQIYNTNMVTGFAALIENRDDSTGGHVQRTRGYVNILLNEMRKYPKYNAVLSKDYIENVLNAAPLHDIGKIATPDYILKKPARLTNEEFAVMKEHAARGGDIIRETFSNLDEPEYQQIAYEMARYHHEKWNGKGYPDGLKGNEIPLHARIMAIADVFDAVSAKRCYRDALPMEECVRIIKEGAGTDFDPELVSLFLKPLGTEFSGSCGISNRNRRNLL